MPIYNVNGKTYNIPENLVDKFEKDMPNASIRYENEGKLYDIPLSKKDGFTKAFPNARFYGTEPTQQQEEYPQAVIDAHNDPNNVPPHYKDMATINRNYQQMQKAKTDIQSEEAAGMGQFDYGNMVSTPNGMMPDLRGRKQTLHEAQQDILNEQASKRPNRASVSTPMDDLDLHPKTLKKLPSYEDKIDKVVADRMKDNENVKMLQYNGGVNPMLGGYNNPVGRSSNIVGAYDDSRAIKDDVENTIYGVPQSALSDDNAFAKYYEEESRLNASNPVPEVKNNEELMEYLVGRFNETEDGKQAIKQQNEDYNKYINENWWPKFKETKAYKEIESKEYHSQAEADEATNKLNEAWNDYLKVNADEIDKGAEPIYEAYSQKFNQRYGVKATKEGEKYFYANKGNENREKLRETEDDIKNIRKEIENVSSDVEEKEFGREVPSLRPEYYRAKDKRYGELEDKLAEANAVKKIRERTDQIVQAAKDNDQTFFHQMGRAAANELTNVDNYTLGITQLFDANLLNNILRKAENGNKLTDSEEKLLDAASENFILEGYYRERLSQGYGVGETSAVSLAFMAEFLLNPVSSSGNALAKGLLNYGIKRFGKSVLRKAAKGIIRNTDNFAKGAARLATDYMAGLGKMGVNLVGQVGAATGMTFTSSLAGVAADALRRQNQDYEFGYDENGDMQVVRKGEVSDEEALGKAFLSRGAENLSEMIFNPLNVLAKEAGRMGVTPQVFNRLFSNKAPNAWARAYRWMDRSLFHNPTLNAVMERAQFHGLPEEYFEEVINNLMNVGMGEMTVEDALSIDNNIDTFLSLVPTSVLFGGIGVLSYGAQRSAIRSQNKQLLGKLDSETKRQLSTLEQLPSYTGFDDIGDAMRDVMMNNGLSKEGRKAALTMLYNIAKDRAMSQIDAEREAIANGTTTLSPEEQMQASHEEGYDTTEPEVMNEAKNDYETALTEVQRLYADDYIEELNENPMGALRLSASWTDEEKQATIDYINAKQRYEGMLQRVRDDIDGMVQASDAEIDSQVNTGTGMVQSATLKNDNRQVHIIDGNVALLEDGSIDTANSTQDIIVRDAQTGKVEFVSPSAFLSVDEAMDPEALKVQAAENIRLAKAQEAADQIDGTLTFQQGDTYEGVDAEGQPVQIDIISDNGDDTVNVGINGEAAGEPMQKEAVQQLVNNARRAQAVARREDAASQRAKNTNLSEPSRSMTEGRDAYSLNEEIGVTLPDGSIGTAVIDTEANADGQYTVRLFDANGNDYFERPVRQLTADQLNAMQPAEVQAEAEQQSAPTKEAVSSDLNGEQGQPVEQTATEETPNKEDSLIEVSDIYSIDRSSVTKPGIVFMSRKTDDQGYTIIKLKRSGVNGKGNTVLSGTSGMILSVPVRDIVAEGYLDDEDSDGGLDEVYNMNSAQVNEIRIAPDGKFAGTIRINKKEGGLETFEVVFNDNPLKYIADVQLTEREQQKLQSVSNEQENNDKMPMIEVDGEMVPDYAHTTPQRSQRYIYEESGLSKDDADDLVKLKQRRAKQKLEAAKKKEPKFGDRGIGDSIPKLQKAKAEWQQQVQDTENEVAYWNSVEQEQAMKQRQAAAAVAAENAARQAAQTEQAIKDEEARKAEEAAKAAEQAAVGANNVNPAIREKWNAAQKVEGNSGEMVLANGERIPGRYVLVESGAASASHNALNGFRPTEGFPVDENGQSVNDRDYERDTDAQDITRRIADNYDQRALQTPVVVSSDGVVLSGNGRTMAGELAAAQNTDQAYTDYLRSHPERFGFTAEQVSQMQHPRVVFVPDGQMPYTAETFGKFNQQEMKGQSKSEQAVKLGKVVDDQTFGRILRGMNRFDSLGAYYNDTAAATEAVRDLQRAGAISEAQLPQMFDGDTLSPQGREILENTLIGKAFEGNPDAVRMITAYKGMRQGVVTALSELANNVALGEEYSLQDELAQAIALVYEARNKGGFKAGERVSSYAMQGNLFQLDEGATVADYENATVMMLADVLNDNRSTQLKKVMTLYNQHAAESASGQMDIFSGGVQNKEDIINFVRNIVNNRTEAEQQQALDQAREQRKQAATAGNEESVPAGESGEGSEVNIAPSDQLKPTDLRDSVKPDEAKLGEYKLSDKKDNKGNIFFEKNGSIDLWSLSSLFKEGGREDAPIRLTDRNLQHILDEHKKEQDNSPEKVFAFLDKVFANATMLRRAGGGAMYAVLNNDKTDEAAIIKLYPSEHGDYYNVESAGYYRKDYWKDNNDVIADLSELSQSDADSNVSKPQTPTNNGKELINAETQQSSENKDNTSSDNIQENQQKNVQQQIEDARKEVDQNPTEAQKEAGNYKKGHIKLDGYDISIENPKGSTRSGVDEQGKEWSVTMNNDYGYLRGTEGVDGSEMKRDADMAETELRDALIETMREAGIDVITDAEAGQQVLDMANEEATLSRDKKRAEETASLTQEGGSRADISTADIANVSKILESFAKELEKVSSNRKNFLKEVGEIIKAKQYGSGSRYSTIETKNGGNVTIRLANHNATVKGFDYNDKPEGISIVISRRRNEGIDNNGNAHVIEFFYSDKELKRAEGKPLAQIVRSIQQALYSGEYKDTTGLAQREEVNPDGIREQRVYHGSGASFDTFDHNHMGEGEGGQAYGWGSYVTEVKKIAKFYASNNGAFVYKGKKLSDLWNGEQTGENMVAYRVLLLLLQGTPFENAVAHARSYAEEGIARFGSNPVSMEHYRDEIAALDRIKKKDFTQSKRILYTVEIPDDNGDNYFDYTKVPNAKQWNNIREAVLALLAKRYPGISQKEREKYVDKGFERAKKEEYSQGGYIYDNILISSTRSAKAASELLHSLGYTGIKYPANYKRNGRADGAKNYVIFEESDLKITDKVQFFRTSNGDAYGFTVNGKIYIDPRIATAETPIHEYGHLWTAALRKANPAAWERLKEQLLGQKDVLDYVKGLYPELKGDALMDEVFQHYAGRRGAERLRSEQQRLLTENKEGAFGVARIVTVFDTIRRALQSFWNQARDLFAGNNANLKSLSAEDFADMMMADLLNGYKPDTVENSEVMEQRVGGENSQTAYDFATRNKGVGRVAVVNAETGYDILRQRGVDAAKAREVMNAFKAGDSGRYLTKYDLIIAFDDGNVSEKELNSYLWHEATHRVIHSYGIPQDTVNAIASYIKDIDRELYDKVMRLYGDSSEEVKNEEVLAWFMEDMAEIPEEKIHPNDAKVPDGNPMGQQIINIVKLIRYGRRTEQRRMALAEVDRGSQGTEGQAYNEVRLSEGTDGTGGRSQTEGNNLRGTGQEFSRRGTEIGGKAEARDAYEAEVARAGYQVREALQDSMRGLHALYKAVLGDEFTTIEAVPGFENAYTAENRLSSADSAQQTDYEVRYFSHITDAVYKLTGTWNIKGDRYQELTDYMMAKHGLERNVVLAERDARRASEDWLKDVLVQLSGRLKTGEINQAAFDRQKEAYERQAQSMHDEELAKNRKTDYAGLTALTGKDDVAEAEAEARKIVADYETSERKPAIDELWEAVRNATHETLRKTYEGGLMSKDAYESTLDMFQYYIPLRGFNEKTSDQVYDYLTSNDGPLKGSVLKTAGGRKSKADDPIAYISQMANKAIMEANRNRMKQTFMNFVLNHPSDLVSVSDMWIRFNDASGEWEPELPPYDPNDSSEENERKRQVWEENMKHLAASEPKKYKRASEVPNIPYRVLNNNLREHQVLVKRGGRTYVLTINGSPRAAEALNGLTNPDTRMSRIMEIFQQVMGNLLRFMSNVMTTGNPNFVLSNFLRDFGYTSTIAIVKENANYAKHFEKNRLRFNPVMLHRMFRKFEKGTLDDSNETERLFRQFMMNGGETGYTNVLDIIGHKKEIGRALKRKGNLAARFTHAIGLQYDLVNRSVENVARFAAFVTSREMGRSLERSIWDAKEISVNFNKKGSADKFFHLEKATKAGNVAAAVSTIGRLTQVFFNAAVQAIANFGTAGVRNPSKFAVLVSSLVSMGYMQGIFAELLGGDDDDEYDNLPEYLRRSSLVVRVPGYDYFATLPLTQEYRAFFGMGELLSGIMRGKERLTPSEAAIKMTELLSQALPVDMMEGGGGLSAIVPSQVKPVYEVWVNKDWNGLPIYRKDVYPGEERKPEWTRVYKSADKTLVELSKAVSHATGGVEDFQRGWLEINPAVVESVIDGYLGGYWKTALQLKKTAETLLGERDFEPRNIFLLNRIMAGGDERTANGNDREKFYKYKKEAEDTKYKVTNYEKAKDLGIEGMAEKFDFLYNSPEYGRMEIYERYRPEIDGLTKDRKEAASEGDEEAVADYDADILDAMRRMNAEMEEFDRKK